MSAPQASDPLVITAVVPTRLGINVEAPSTFGSVNHIPLEILQEIFLYCLPNKMFIIPHRTTAPLVLTQISRGWRRVALSSPRLWLSFSFSTKGPAGKFCRGRQALMELWFGRSGRYPLSLFAETDKISFHPLVEFIRDNCHRWRHLHLDIADTRTSAFLRALMACPTSLETLTMQLYPCHFHSRRSSLPPVIYFHFPAAPRLRHFSWLCWGYPWPVQRVEVELPWFQLVQISLGYSISVNKALDILTTCPGLASCEFSNLGRMDPTLRHDVVIPDLHTLKISGTGGFLLVSALVLPSLRCLSMGSVLLEGYGVWSQFQFASLLSRSSCSLRSFALNNMKIQAQEFVECLRLNSTSLVELRVAYRWTNYYGMITDDTLDLLTPELNSSPSSSSCLCPHLKDIDFRLCISASVNRFIDMVVARRRPYNSADVLLRSDLVGITDSESPTKVTALERLTVHIDDLDSNSRQQLMKMRNENFELEIIG